VVVELKTNVLYYGDKPQTLRETLRFAQGDRGFAQGDERSGSGVKGGASS
jgi:hypothetical protein